MKRTLRELYGVGVLFLYFFKWPYLLGFPYLYTHGLDNNFILDGLWFLAIFLILKDLYSVIKRRKINQCDTEPKQKD